MLNKNAKAQPLSGLSLFIIHHSAFCFPHSCPADVKGTRQVGGEAVKQ
jgi:hypothetical protein